MIGSGVDFNEKLRNNIGICVLYIYCIFCYLVCGSVVK